VNEAVASQSNERSDGLREKLAWLMLFRLALVTLLLVSALVVGDRGADVYSDPAYGLLVALIITTYVATVIYATWIRMGRDLVTLAFVQLVGDVVVVGGLVFLTGGIESIFSFLFFLVIFNGAILVGRVGALFAASSASFGFVVIGVVQYARLPSLDPFVLTSAPSPTESLPVYAMLVHLVAFYSVAVLSGYLAEKLGQVGSELEQRQIDLRELRALHEVVVHSVVSGLVVVDRASRVLVMNESAADITGLPLSQSTLRTLVELPEQLREMIAKATAANGRVEGQVAVSRGGPRYISVAAGPLKSPEGRGESGWIVVMHDLTEVRTLEQENARNTHLAAIGNLSAAIAHEIRNPLAAISGSIEMLKRSVSDDADEAPLMDIVIREVDRLNLLIGEFLDYARPRSVELVPVDMVELVGETVRIFMQDHALASGVEFRVASDTDAVFGLVDRHRFHQVMWNLLRNACEAFDGEGGAIDVIVESSRADRVEVIVEDDGPGFQEGALEQLFEPFYTTKHQGTGLGLATCYRIIADHGGNLRAERRDARGARFRVEVRAAVTPSGSSMRASHAVASADSR